MAVHENVVDSRGYNLEYTEVKGDTYPSISSRPSTRGSIRIGILCRSPLAFVRLARRDVGSHGYQSKAYARNKGQVSIAVFEERPDGARTRRPQNVVFLLRV